MTNFFTENIPSCENRKADKHLSGAVALIPCARIRGVIMCRRSSRQCIARLIRLRSTLHPPPGSGNLASMILRWGAFITVKI
jgi:hypothetical protein